MKIDRSYDVPALAGTSKDGRTVYIDRHVPKRIKVGGRSVDPAKYLAIHETDEFRAMARGEKYKAAHKGVATPAERQAVEADGLDWKSYSAVMSGLLRATEKETASRRLPPDLNPEPYDEGDWSKKQVRQMASGERASRRLDRGGRS